MNKILTFIFLIVLLSIPSFAQTTTANGIETEYDRFKDSTTVSVKLRVFSDLSLEFTNTFDGKK